MSVCVFKTKELKRCIVHALAAKEWRMGQIADGRPAGPGLFFVHDDGIYCMSNGEPGDVPPGQIGLYCAYAKNCNPNKDENFWENSRLLVGGDDFAELLRIKPEWFFACDQFDELHVTVTNDKITTAFVRPKKEALAT